MRQVSSVIKWERKFESCDPKDFQHIMIQHIMICIMCMYLDHDRNLASRHSFLMTWLIAVFFTHSRNTTTINHIALTTPNYIETLRKWKVKSLLKIVKMWCMMREKTKKGDSLRGSRDSSWFYVAWHDKKRMVFHHGIKTYPFHSQYWNSLH